MRRRAAERPELTEQPTVSGEDVAIGEITLAEVDRAMAGLGEDQRAALSLVAIEGLSYKEAAAALDVPIGTIMSRLARARAALAQAFEDGAGTDAAVRENQDD